MLRTIRYVVMVAALTVSGVALAHEGEDHGADADKHLMGTIEAVAGDKLTVKSTDGKQVAVHVDESTKYEKGGGAGKAADLKAGTKVAVHGEMMKDGTLHATKIRFGKTGVAPAKDGAPSKKEHADHPKK